MDLIRENMAPIENPKKMWGTAYLPEIATNLVIRRKSVVQGIRLAVQAHLIVGIEQRTSLALYERRRAAFDQPGSNVLVLVSFRPRSSRHGELRALHRLDTRKIPVVNPLDQRKASTH